MKGDFSRSTFDPDKHYTSVRMQQGRVQLDADWNEQADILLHLIRTQLQDLLGPGGTAVTEPGFAITRVEPAEGLADQADFQIGAGRYYVDGILCENEAPVLFSKQPDYPAAASELKTAAGHDHVLVYLDVWQRHITFAEDPAIREAALGGADTTTRVKTVWQVKLLPLSGDPIGDQGWRERGSLRTLADWEQFVKRATDKGCLQAQWKKEEGAFLENHLYRVEIHSAPGDQVTFKWSRENGSVVFPIGEEYLFTWEDVPGNDKGRLLRYLREDLALDWAKNNQISASKSEDGKTIRIENGEHWAEIALNTEEKTATLTTSDEKHLVLGCRQEDAKLKVYTYIGRIESETIQLNLEGLHRDPYQLSETDWLEIVDDVMVLKGYSLPLGMVKELDRQNGQVTIRAGEESIKRIITEIGNRELQHPLLRRWEADTKSVIRREEKAGQDDDWLDLEHGIQVAFPAGGTYQVGDYWLIPARTNSEDGIEWPKQDGQPLPQKPHGIAHHYAPLALLQSGLLQSGEREWQVDDLRLRFDSLTAVKARFETRLTQVDVRLDEQKDNHDQLCHRVDVLEERQANSQAPLVQYFQIENGIDVGHVVSVIPADPSDEPESELEVRLATSESERDRRLVVGVVNDILEDRESCRVVLYGRAQCKVVGEIKPGDVLVPSRKSGYAQKAGRFARPATILGKALGSIKFDAEVMEEIDEGMRPVQIAKSKWTGTVDMMVTLG